MHIFKIGYVLSLEEERRAVHKNFVHESRQGLKAATLDDIRRSGAPYYKYIASPSDTCKTLC